MEETSHFSAFFVDSDGSHDYYHYLGILDYTDSLPDIVKVIAERVMERIHANNIEVMLEVDDLPVLCTIPKDHIMYLLKEFILKASRIMNKPITIVAEEFSVKNSSRTDRSTLTTKRSDSMFTKDDYALLIRLLKAKTMQFSVDIYLKSYTRAYDHYDEKRAVNAIVKFINDNVFWQDDIDYSMLFNASHIPRLFMTQDELTIHLFDNKHPLITEQRVIIAKDLSNLFINLSVSELYSELLHIINYWPLTEPEIAITIESEDDYEYINLLTKNCRIGIIKTIYHATSPFIESCKRFYIEAVETDMHYRHRSNDPVIARLIALHDLQYGLTDDEVDYPEYPPEDMDILPKPLRTVLYKIGKNAI